MNTPWFLLYGGESVDGAGEGKYIGRTTDKEKARRHYLKCEENPYSIGEVIIVTDTSEKRAGPWTKWEEL